MALAGCTGTAESDDWASGTGTDSNGSAKESDAPGDSEVPSSSGETGDSGNDSSDSPDPSGRSGILNCPPVEAPEYTRGVDATLSAPFALSCGSCHGASGAGVAPYPAIPGELSFEQFRTAVREGRGAMPAFSTAFISDDPLESDYASLTALADGAAEALLPSAGEWTWTEQQVEAAASQPPDHSTPRSRPFALTRRAVLRA